jgi:hypothetical protein
VLRALFVVGALALTVYAVVDCVQTDDRFVRYLPKGLWVVLIVVVPVVAPLAWLLSGHAKSLPPGRRPITGPRGPEDDPDFLRNL